MSEKPPQWPSPFSEAKRYLTQATTKRLAAIWSLVFGLVGLVLTNPYAIAMARMDPVVADAYRFQLSLVAASFYLVPLLAVLVGHDWYGRWRDLVAEWGGESLPTYARSELVRIAFIALVAVGFVAASILGAHTMWIRQAKAMPFLGGSRFFEAPRRLGVTVERLNAFPHPYP